MEKQRPADGSASEGPPRLEAVSDVELLGRFVSQRDESAFAALMARHGPMVLGVCRRILRHTQDAEDAMQAAFLVLARKAGSVTHHQSLASWLYRVAYRIAVQAKIRIDKRRQHEKQLAELPHPLVSPAEVNDWRIWLDHELNLLPERYRAVLVACDLQGRSRQEAARLLGVAEGTVSSRLARGRRLLAKRLSRYGLSLSGGSLAALLAQEAWAVPPSLMSALVSAASGQGAVSASVGFLTKGALKAMFLTKLKWTVGVVMVAAALGATSLAYRATGQTTLAPAKAEKEVGGKPPSELEILRREVELLKLKLEVVQEKQRTQEAELHALQRQAEAAAMNRAVEAVLRKRREEIKDKQTTPSAGPPRDDSLQWPKALQSADFKFDRERVRLSRKKILLGLQAGVARDDAALANYRAELRSMKETLEGKADQLPSDEYIESLRYLRDLGELPSKLSAEQAPKAEREADLLMLEERAAWSERMSRPGRQYLTIAQAEADQARLKSARLALREMETRQRLQEVETALKALREARGTEAKRRAADELEKLLKKLREQLDKPEDKTTPPKK